MTAAADAAPRSGVRRTPTILQMEAIECGAASLAMVLAHHGCWMPLKDVRRLCGVSRDGSKAAHVLRAARKLGMEAKGYSYAADMVGELPMPAIVFVNMNHFMVLDGVSRGRVHLNDPATGRFSLTPEEFARIFSGVILTFRPTPAFAPTGSPPAVLRPLLNWLAGAREAVALAVFAGLALVIPGIVIPAFSRVFVDDFLIEQKADWFEWLLAIMAGTIVVQVALAVVQQWCQLALRTRTSVLVASRFVWRLLRLPVDFFAVRSPANLSGRLELVEQLSQHAGIQLTNVVISLVAMTFFAVVMLFYSPVLAAIAVGMALAGAFTFLGLQGAVQEGERKSALDGVKVGAKTMQGLAQIEILKANGTDDAFFESWAGQYALFANVRQKLGEPEALFAALPQFLSALANVMIVLAAAVLIMNGRLTIGTLAGFLVLQAAFFLPMQQLLKDGLLLKKARGTLDQIEDVLQHHEAREFARQPDDDVAPPARATVLGRIGKLEGHIVVRGLTFGYNPAEPALLRDFAFELAPGSRLALVGGSGSGKSTVGRLIAGLFDPWEGEVRIDGRSLADVPRELLRNSMAAVDQDIVTFEGSIRDNITLWDATMPEERIVRAAKDAMIHDDIVRRPGGYQAHVEEGGRNFSGGQRQRLEIARALVAEPSTLILDEATSALDPVVEKEVMNNIRRRGCSCIIIAHRLSTIRDCDEIVVMHRGDILQRGTHDSMMQEDGPYRRLIEN